MNKVTHQPVAPGSGARPLTIARMSVRILGAVQIILGLIWWITQNDGLVPAHVIIGSLFVLSLWAVAFLAARAGVNPGMVAAGFIWGLIIPIYGIAQINLVPGPAHWVIQVIHLLIGMAGMGLGERLARSTQMLETGTAVR